MGKHYNRLSLNERIEIEKCLALNHSFADIARMLNRHKSTIQREVVKHRRPAYKAIDALHLAVSNQSNKRWRRSKIKASPELEKYVLQKLHLYWSPMQICVDLKRNFPNDLNMQLSHEAIYSFIYVHCKKELRLELIKQLRQKRAYRGNVRRGKDKRTNIVDPVRIDERPDEVLARQIPGHWEGDLIMGKDRNSVIGTLVERSSRLLLLVPLKARDATTVRLAFVKAFKSIPKHLKKSLTYDNGSEMAQHKIFQNQTNIKVFFTHPYSPWQRPTNENTNGLLRDYFPKGMDLNTVSNARLKEVQKQLNERPRKVLNWQTPAQVFHQFIINEIDP
jgi:IS30 family transposase